MSDASSTETSRSGVGVLPKLRDRDLRALHYLVGHCRPALALVVSHVLVQVIKRSVARPRPVLEAGLESLIPAPDRFSFPSGHAAATLSVAVGLQPALGLGAVLFF